MGWTQRDDSPRKLNKVNKQEWKQLFIEFKHTELYERTPSLCTFVVFQDWVAEQYDAPNKKQLIK